MQAVKSTRISTHPSARVKSTDWHPTSPWLALGLYTGSVLILHSSQDKQDPIVRTLQVSTKPIRAVRFVARMNWLVTGSDDLHLRVFDCTTWTLVKDFVAHDDYIRFLDIHPRLPLVLSCGDDALVKTWNWDNDWKKDDTFIGHEKYVMMAKFNPHDGNMIASASLDASIRLWRIGSSEPTATLSHAHSKGLNCLTFDPKNRDLLVTGADDFSAKMWNIKSYTLVRTFEGHQNNVTDTLVHPTLPLLITSSEDSTVRIWHPESGDMIQCLDEGIGRVWSLTLDREHLAIGCDQGCSVVELDHATSSISSKK